MHYHCSQLCTVYKRDIIHVVVWSRVSCTTTVQNYAQSTSATLYMWFFWSRVSCTTTVQNCTPSASGTLYRWLFGAVLVALPLFKTIHCPQARHYTGGCLEPCYLHYHCSKYTLSTSATLHRWLIGAVLVALPLFKTIHCL